MTQAILTPDELISKVMNAQKIEDLLDIADFKNEYRDIVSAIHPDVCTAINADKATAKLNEFKDRYENGTVYTDELGKFRTNGYWVEYVSKEKALKWSFENHQRFYDLKDKTSEHFKKYLPYKSIIGSMDSFRFEFEKRAIPMSGLELPQVHVNWILSRLLEYCAYLSEIGFVHCGLTPESVFIIPENHGIQICSFYHLTRINNVVKTVSAKYGSWYPTELFINKIATPTIDLEMSKRIAAYLLGDKSGTGIRLRKTHNEDFISFIIKQHTSAYQALCEYKELLNKKFKKEFHSLTI